MILPMPRPRRTTGVGLNRRAFHHLPFDTPAYDRVPAPPDNDHDAPPDRPGGWTGPGNGVRKQFLTPPARFYYASPSCPVPTAPSPPALPATP